jgi:hypothetical protein
MENRETFLYLKLKGEKGRMKEKCVIKNNIKPFLFMKLLGNK